MPHPNSIVLFCYDCADKDVSQADPRKCLATPLIVGEQEDIHLVVQICTYMDGLMTHIDCCFSHEGLNLASGRICDPFIFKFGFSRAEGESVGQN